ISGSAIAGAFSDAGALAMIAGSVLTLEVTSQLVRFLAPRFEVMRARRASAAAESGGGANGSPPVEERASAWRGLIVTFRSPYLLGIAGYIFCYALTSTLLYLQQAYVVEAAFASSGERRAYFASVDLWVNILTLAGQLFLTGRV